jgi:hypothetical protein
VKSLPTREKLVVDIMMGKTCCRYKEKNTFRIFGPTGQNQAQQRNHLVNIGEHLVNIDRLCLPNPLGISANKILAGLPTNKIRVHNSSVRDADHALARERLSIRHIRIQDLTTVQQLLNTVTTDKKYRLTIATIQHFKKS